MKNKKFLIILIIIAGILFVLAKIYHLTMVDDLYYAIDKFKSEDNRYYSVEQIISEKYYKDEVFIKQEIIKYIESNEKIDLYCEWKNLETNEQYSFDVNNKKLDKTDLSIENEDFMKNLPNFVSFVCKDNKFNISSVMKVRYIIPTKYNNKDCYKIVTKSEIVIIDKDTYLPVYSVMKTHNSSEEEKIKIEKIYEFEVGSVTDEDVKLPDFSNYIINENLK